MDITLWIIVLVLGALAGAGTYWFGKKKDTRKMFGVATIILLGGALILGFGYPNLAFSTAERGFVTLAVAGTQGTTAPQEIVVDSSGCAVEDTTVTLASTNAYTSGATGGNHKYKVNGAPAKTVSDAGTFTASPGNQIQVLWGNGSDSSYFGDVETYTVPCQGTKTFSTERYENGSITIQAFNEEGDVIGGSANETLGAGDVVDLDLELKGSYQKGFPHGGVIVAEYNSTTIDDAIISTGSKVSTPDFYTVSATDMKTKAYSVPAILSNKKLSETITIDADDTNDPGLNSDLILTYYPNDYFINENEGGAFQGPAVEDEDDAQTFSHATSYTLHID